MRTMRTLFLVLIALFLASCIEPDPESYYGRVNRKDEFTSNFQSKRLANELIVLFDMGEKSQYGNDYFDNALKIADYENDVKLSEVKSFLASKGAAPLRVYERAVKSSGKNKFKRYSGRLNAEVVALVPFDTQFRKAQKNCFDGTSLCLFNEFPLLIETDVEGDMASMMINFVEVKSAFNNYQDGFTPVKIIIHTATYTGAKLNAILSKIPKKAFENNELN